MRVIQCSEELRLTLEPGDAVRVAGERFRKHLDRDVASELRVARTVDVTHPAGAKT